MASSETLSKVVQPWSRHELLRIARTAWPLALASRPQLASVPYLADWIDNDWPVVVRRPTGDDRSDLVSVGISLPPSVGKQRICLMIPPKAVLERSSPPCLWAARGSAGPAWAGTIRRLMMLGARHGVAPTVIGSLLWQYRTGLQYLTPDSDLDLLWRVHTGSSIRALLAGIEAVERAGRIRVDGEIIFPDGGAVNWRELHLALNRKCVAEIVVKSMNGVELMKISELPTLRGAA